MHLLEGGTKDVGKARRGVSQAVQHESLDLLGRGLEIEGILLHVH